MLGRARSAVRAAAISGSVERMVTGSSNGFMGVVVLSLKPFCLLFSLSPAGALPLPRLLAISKRTCLLLANRLTTMRRSECSAQPPTQRSRKRESVLKK